MACSNYCTKENFSQLSSSMGYGSRSGWRTATLSVTNERALAHDIEKAEKRYEVYVEATHAGADIGGKTAESEAREAVEHTQKPAPEYQATVKVSPTHIELTHVSRNPSSTIVTAMIATAIAATVLSRPVSNFLEGLIITAKGYLESKE